MAKKQKAAAQVEQQLLPQVETVKVTPTVVIPTDVKQSPSPISEKENPEEILTSIGMPGYTSIKSIGTALNSGKTLKYNTSTTVLPQFGAGAQRQTWRKAMINSMFMDVAPGAPVIVWINGHQNEAVYVDSKSRTINGVDDQVFVQLNDESSPIQVSADCVMPSRVVLPAGNYFGEARVQLKRGKVAELLGVELSGVTPNMVDDIAASIFEEGSDELSPSEFRVVFTPLHNLGHIAINGHRNNLTAGMIDLMHLHAGTFVYWGVSKDKTQGYTVKTVDNGDILAYDKDGRLNRLPIVGYYIQATNFQRTLERSKRGLNAEMHHCRFIPAGEISPLEKFMIVKYQVPATMFQSLDSGDEAPLQEGYDLKVMNEIAKTILGVNITDFLEIPCNNGKVTFARVPMAVLNFLKK